MSQKMMAVFMKQHGKQDVIEIGEQPLPVPGEKEVLIKLKTASLNHLDIWVRRGTPGIKPTFPHIFGSDGAGVIAELGSAVKNWQPGDEVIVNPSITCGQCRYCLAGEQSLCLSFRVMGENINGSFAEYVCVPAVNLFAKSSNLSWNEAAAFPLVFVTAWRMLITRAGLKPGETVLIPGIGGGLATAALAIARHIGCQVIVTSSSQDKLARAKKLGAVLGIDYTSEKVVSAVRKWTAKRGVDVVVECVGGDHWRHSLQCLCKGGRLVTAGATTGGNPSTDIPRIFWNQLTILGSTMGSHRDFSEVHRLLNQGQLRPVIDSVHPLAEFKTAHQHMVEKKHFGKIVLTIDN